MVLLRCTVDPQNTVSRLKKRIPYFRGVLVDEAEDKRSGNEIRFVAYVRNPTQCSRCPVPRRLSPCERGGRARDEGKGKGCETSGRFCFQDGGVFNGG